MRTVRDVDKRIFEMGRMCMAGVGGIKGRDARRNNLKTSSFIRGELRRMHG